MGSYGSSELCIELVGGLIELEQRLHAGIAPRLLGKMANHYEFGAG